MKKLVIIVGLVAVAAVGIVYVPKMLQALEEARLKRTVADIRNTGTAMFSWLTDEVGAVPDDRSNPRTLVTLVSSDQHRHELRPGTSTAFHLASFSAAQGSPAIVDLSAYQRISHADLTKKLVPQYLQQIPVMDGWEHPYEFYLNDAQVNGPVMLMRSAGKDGVYSGLQYTVSAFDAAKNPGEDIVWADGFFVRWPQSIKQ